MSTLADNLMTMLEPTVSTMGYQLWGIEYLPNRKNSILRVYIDSAEGIDVDDCAAVSRQVSGLLDVEDPIPGEYNLEVSSPGLDRLLFTADQYDQYIGCLVRVKLNTPVEGRKNFKGKLIAVEGEQITIELNDGDELRGQSGQSGGDSEGASSVTIGLWQVNRGQLVSGF